jgi:hypothetical protein
MPEITLRRHVAPNDLAVSIGPRQIITGTTMYTTKVSQGVAEVLPPPIKSICESPIKTDMKFAARTIQKPSAPPPKAYAALRQFIGHLPGLVASLPDEV